MVPEATAVPATTNPVGTGHILIDGVRKSFSSGKHGEVLALADLQFEVEAGSFVAILGPSGCGKTTLLNIVAGFEAPSAGSVQLDGKPIAGPGPDRGVVFQDHALFPWLTVEKNITYGLKQRRVGAAERKQIAERFIALAGLKGFEKRYPHELSGGMRQRVGLIRVLANDASVLLMDEPFASVDAQTRRFLQREIERIWLETTKTVFFITHSVEEAFYLADTVFVMTARPGRIREVIPVDLERPRDITSIEFNELRRRAETIVEEEANKALQMQQRPDEPPVVE